MSIYQKKYEIRCPVYGFINVADWEMEIINHRYFQRLRRIRQLGWTDLVYPGAMHTRFEHSLGVMYMATLLYDGIVQRSREVLQGEMRYDDSSLERHRMLVRLAALLHDVGHAPFSHAAEGLFPTPGEGKRPYTHEDYSAEIVRRVFGDIFQNNRHLHNHGITAEAVAGLLDNSPEAGAAVFWRDLISGQMDADRMDYLLRDSLHIGVEYGRYDWRRLVHTIEAMPNSEDENYRPLGVKEGGWHAAESLILARYFMFTQVYFHKTRVAFDHHLEKALEEILPGGIWPPPTEENLHEYLKWDDWRVLGLLAEGKGGEHGRRLVERDQYRLIRETPETPKEEHIEQLEKWRGTLGDLLAAEEQADKSWYKTEQYDIPVLSESRDHRVSSLSQYSSFVDKIEPIKQVKLYVRKEDRDEAGRRLERVKE